MTKQMPQDCKDMSQIRAQIDRVDRELVDLLAQRFGYIKRAWKIKYDEDMAALVPWRVQDVVEKVRRRAADHDLPEEMIEALWRQMMGWFIQYEDEKLREKMERKS